MPITCSNCGAQQPDGAAFCDECGAALNQPQVSTPSPSFGQPAPTVVASSDTCPVCGAPTTPGEPFCTNCGASLGGGAAAPPPPAPGAPAPTVMASPPQQREQPQPSPGGALSCANCGARLEPDSAFCDMCGAPVSAPSPPPQPPKAPPQQYPPSSPPYTPTPAAPQEPAAPQPQPQPQAPYTPPPPPSQARLVIQGTNASLPFPAGKTEIIIGREDPVSGVFPDIDLTDHGGDEGGVSRQHARIFMQQGQYHIEDLDSTNYTFVNQEKLPPRQPHPIKDGAELRFGRVKAVFHTSI